MYLIFQNEISLQQGNFIYSNKPIMLENYKIDFISKSLHRYFCFIVKKL